MNKLKDTRVFGDLIVDDSITKNNKEVATEEYVDTKLSAKQDKLTLNSGQVLGGASSGTGEVEAINTVNINQIKVSDLNDGSLYAKKTEIPTAVTNIATQRLLGRYSTGTGNVQPITLGSNLTLSTGGVLSATNTVYTHPNSGVTAGTYRSVTVNAQGHVTTGTNPTTLAGYGITLSGDVTNSGNAITIGPKKVTLSKIQDIETGKVLGRTTTGNGSPEAIDTVNINQIKVSDLDDGDLYAKTTDLISGLAGKAPLSHEHTIANVTGLQSALDNKSATGHSHTIANVTGLQGELDGKAPSTHNHAYTNITGLTANTVLGRTSGDGPAELISTIQIPSWAMKSSLAHGDIPYATSSTRGGVRVKVVGTSVYIYTTD